MFKNFKKFSQKQKILFVILYGLIVAAAVFSFVMNSRRVSKEQAAANAEVSQPVITAVASDVYTDTDARDLHHAQIVIRGRGTVTLALDASSAPATVSHFLALAQDGFYNGCSVYRAVTGYILQMGDNSGKNAPTVIGEFSSNGQPNNPISHIRGTVSLARGSENDSGSSEFFICLSDCTELDGNYASFGWVTDGLDVLDSINRDSDEWAKNRYGLILQTKSRPIIEEIRIID